MNINDPFSLAKFQKMVQRTQKAVDSINTVSAKLSHDYSDSKHQPALQSLAKTMEGAAANLEKVSGTVAKTEQQVRDIALQTQTQANMLKVQANKIKRQVRPRH